MNILRLKLTSLKMPSCVECFVLLHSPIIIDMNKFPLIRDPTSEEIIDFFSDCEIVTGCFFMKQEKSFIGFTKLNPINNTIFLED